MKNKSHHMLFQRFRIPAQQKNRPSLRSQQDIVSEMKMRNLKPLNGIQISVTSTKYISITNGRNPDELQ